MKLIITRALVTSQMTNPVRKLIDISSEKLTKEKIMCDEI